MQQKVILRVLPTEAADADILAASIAAHCAVKQESITGYYILKQSIDARSKTIWINLTVVAFINEPFTGRPFHAIDLKHVTHASQSAIIIGSGPAGLFAALKLLELGIKPIILERGKDVRSRRRDLASLNKQGIVNSDSNYSFGEGGAGTYSDGKLYTRSNKRGDISRILNLFVQFGADEKILYEAHPHIGTNKLPHIIIAMREAIIACGGEVHFNCKATDFVINNNRLTAVKTTNGNSFTADAAVLATGHSARDIFELLRNKNLLIEAKPFALGVRVEHPQSLIDTMQYHCAPAYAKQKSSRPADLPPASYSFVQQVTDRAVFSFCMCPGGIIAPAATNPGELVVNGWSPSKRNNPYANSGIVVQTSVKDAHSFLNNIPGRRLTNSSDPLLLMYFQQEIEKTCFNAGGGKFVAPAQRLADLCNNRLSANLPDCSYLPGVKSHQLGEVLPGFIFQALQKGFAEAGKKMRGYFTNDAIVVATESRTSSPVRIPRDENGLHHPQLENLYPCGEGAGYAGGIVSAAMDGERVAGMIAAKLLHTT